MRQEVTWWLYTIQNVKKSHNAHWNLPIYILLEKTMSQV